MNAALARVGSLLLLAPAIASAAAVAPGTHFKVVGFGDNDPRKDDASLIGSDCVAEGTGLERYSGMPFHYGLATCGDSPILIDFLAVKIEIAGAVKPAATPKAAATAKPAVTPKPKATATPKAAKGDATKIAPGTKFIVMEFGENDPLRETSNLVGETCTADGFLLKYKQSPFFYGTAKCGEETVDLLSVRVQLVPE